MLRVNPIKNVNYTLNNQVSFGQGQMTNEIGVVAPVDMVGGNVFKGLKEIIFSSKVKTRTESIEAGMNQTKLNFIA